MKYWMFQNNQVVGPHDREELGNMPTFSPESLVCPEGRRGTQMGDWQRAGVVAELAETLLKKSKVPAGAGGGPVAGESLLPPEPTLRDLAVLGTLQEKVELLENALNQVQEELRLRDDEIGGLKTDLDVKGQESENLRSKLVDLETKMAETDVLKEEIHKAQQTESLQAESIDQIKNQLDTVQTDISTVRDDVRSSVDQLEQGLKDEIHRAQEAAGGVGQPLPDPNAPIGAALPDAELPPVMGGETPAPETDLPPVMGEEMPAPGMDAEAPSTGELPPVMGDDVPENQPMDLPQPGAATPLPETPAEGVDAPPPMEGLPQIGAPIEGATPLPDVGGLEMPPPPEGQGVGLPEAPALDVPPAPEGDASAPAPLEVPPAPEGEVQPLEAAPLEAPAMDAPPMDAPAMEAPPLEAPPALEMPPAPEGEAPPLDVLPDPAVTGGMDMQAPDPMAAPPIEEGGPPPLESLGGAPTEGEIPNTLVGQEGIADLGAPAPDFGAPPTEFPDAVPSPAPAPAPAPAPGGAEMAAPLEGDDGLVDLTAAGTAKTKKSRKGLIFLLLLLLIGGGGFGAIYMGYVPISMISPYVPAQVKDFLRPYLSALLKKGAPMATTEEVAAPVEMPKVDPQQALPDRTQEALAFVKGYRLKSGRSISRTLEGARPKPGLSPWMADPKGGDMFHISFYQSKSGIRSRMPAYRFAAALDTQTLKGLDAPTQALLDGKMSATKKRRSRRPRRRSSAKKSSGLLGDELGQGLMNESLSQPKPKKKRRRRRAKPKPRPVAESDETELPPMEEAAPAKKSRRRSTRKPMKSREELTLDELLLPGVPKRPE
jgi:hypothetical protein